MIVSALTHEPRPVDHRLLLDRAGELLVGPDAADILMACCGTRAAMEGYLRRVMDENFHRTLRTDALGDYLSALKCYGIIAHEERAGASRATKVLCRASHNRAVSYGPAVKAHAAAVELCSLVESRISAWSPSGGGWRLD
jgi:hypothetical protein